MLHYSTDYCNTMSIPVEMMDPGGYEYECKVMISMETTHYSTTLVVIEGEYVC